MFYMLLGRGFSPLTLATDLFHGVVTCVPSGPLRVLKQTCLPGMPVVALPWPPTCAPIPLPQLLKERALGCPLAPWWSRWPL